MSSDGYKHSVGSTQMCTSSQRCAVWREGLANSMGGDVRPLKSQVVQRKGAGGLGPFCEQTRHLSGTDKLEESVLRAAM